MEGLIEGRMVHYVLNNGEHRAAIVAKVWGTNGTANLQVFADGWNDESALSNGGASPVWKTSVEYDENKTAGTWHWIERA